MFIDCFHGTKKRCFLIQRLACIRAECRRDIENSSGPLWILFHKCRRSTIPRCIAPCLKRRSESSRRERRCVRFSLNQFFTRELHQYLPIRSGRRNKRIMFLCCRSGKRLKPVRIMSCTFFNRPLFHLMRYYIGRCRCQFFPLFNCFLQFLVSFFRKTFLHDSIIKYIFPKNISYIYYTTHMFPSQILSFLFPAVIPLPNIIKKESCS